MDGFAASLHSRDVRRPPDNARWYNGRALRWLLGLTAYTVLGLLFTSQVWIDYAYARHPLTWKRAAAVALADWYLWALLTPGVIWLARRFRFDRRHWAGSLTVHIPVSLICTVGKQLAGTFSAMAITGITRAPTTFMKVHVSFLTYWAIVGITYALEHYQKYRERELQAAHLLHGEYTIVLRNGTRLQSSRGHSQRLHAIIRGKA